jgi:hypothetical protein
MAVNVAGRTFTAGATSATLLTLTEEESQALGMNEL